MGKCLLGLYNLFLAVFIILGVSIVLIAAIVDENPEPYPTMSLQECRKICADLVVENQE